MNQVVATLYSPLAPLQSYHNSSPGLAVWTNRLVPLIPSRGGIAEILTHWLHVHAAGSSQSVNHLMEQFLLMLCSPALWCHFLQASVLFDKPQIAVSLSHYFDKYFIFILLIDSSAFLLTQGEYEKKWKIKLSCLTTLLGIDTLQTGLKFKGEFILPFFPRKDISYFLTTCFMNVHGKGLYFIFWQN